jgi:hypothetical protein
LSRPFVERLIVTIHREYIDHALFRNAGDLKRNLEEPRHYLQRSPVHRSIGQLGFYWIGDSSSQA